MLLTLALPGQAAQAPTASENRAANVRIVGTEIPFSTLASAEARDTLASLMSTPPAPDFQSDIEAARRFYGKFNDERLAEMRERYAVKTSRESIAGVPVDVVMPAEAVPTRNRDRVLINLHGGAFMWGAGSGAVLEATPIAATARMQVIAIDYSLAPEKTFPAASVDVAAVYGELLKKYPAANIGIYGCSAGGILTAQSVAWFAAHGLPRPGAIAMLCATGAELAGDSSYLAPILTGQPPVAAGAEPPRVGGLPYLAHASAQDPLAFPAASRDVLARFPPTLLVVGGRDYSASSMTMMHRQLRAADVDAELFVFDGLWHAFFIYPRLPESRETYQIVARFFDDRLGTVRRSP